IARPNPYARVPCQTVPQPLLMTGSGIRGNPCKPACGSLAPYPEADTRLLSGPLSGQFRTMWLTTAFCAHSKGHDGDTAGNDERIFDQATARLTDVLHSA